MEKYYLINMINPNGEIRKVSEYSNKVNYYLKITRIILTVNAVVWCVLLYLFLF